MLQKNKRREALKEFEALKKSNPEAALLKLDEMEKARIKVTILGPPTTWGSCYLRKVLLISVSLYFLSAQERMSLKHQNKGKWARSRAIMGKYDLEVRGCSGKGRAAERVVWRRGGA